MKRPVSSRPASGRPVSGRPVSGRLAASRRYATFAAVALTAISFSAAASAAGLLEPLSGAESSAVAGGPAPSPQAVRNQLVRIDLGYMESNLVPRGIDKARDRVRQAPDGRSVRIDLFAGASVTLDRDGLEKSEGGGYVWSGKVRGGEGGFAVLVISGGKITGQIQTGNRVYTISPVADGVHRISEIDSGLFPPETVVPAPVRPESAGDASESGAVQETNPEAKTKIRVLFPYTKKAKNQSAGIVADAKLAIALANTAATNAGVNIKYKYAGALKIKKFKEKTGSFASDLSKVTAGAGNFAPVHAKRNAKSADLVAMLRKTGDYCGIGWFVANPSAATAGDGFTVTAVNCVTNHSVAHEMGHNSGLEHDRFVVSPTPPNSEYNFGYVNLPAQIRSVMAYNNQCSPGSCTRVPMFSTPKKKYFGDKLGVAKNKPGAADAHRRLNETRSAVAAYR